MNETEGFRSRNENGQEAERRLGCVSVLSKIYPQSDDVVVDDAIGEERAFTPRLIERRVAAEDASAIADEDRQQRDQACAPPVTRRAVVRPLTRA